MTVYEKLFRLSIQREQLNKQIQDLTKMAVQEMAKPQKEKPKDE